MKQLPQLTQEEIQDVIAWFKARRDRLPKELEFMPSVRAANLPDVVEKYVEMAEKMADNPTYHGQIRHLLRMREALQAQGMD